MKVCVRQTFFPKAPDDMREVSCLSEGGGGVSQSSCEALYSRPALLCLHTNSLLTPLKARSGAPDGLTYPSTMALYGKPGPPGRRPRWQLPAPSRSSPLRVFLTCKILLQPGSHFPPLRLSLSCFRLPLRRPPPLSPPVFGSYDRQKDLQAEQI